MRHPKELSKKQLVTLVESIIDRMYVEEGQLNPDKEWDSDTAAEVAEVLESEDLVPLLKDVGKTISEIRRKAKRNIRRVFVHCATIHHRHGVDVFAAPTKKALYDMLYKYAKDWWGEWCFTDDEGNEEKIPKDHEEAVDRYFEMAEEEEYWDHTTTVIKIEE